jgi:hypothetical protein
LAATTGHPEDRQALAASLCTHGLLLRASDKRVEAEAAYRFKLLRDHEEFRELLAKLENPPK